MFPTSNSASAQQAVYRASVNVDINKIGQVLRNLISNALKFTAANGMLSVTAQFESEPNFPNNFTDSSRSSNKASSGRSWSSVGSARVGSTRESHQYVRIDVTDTGIGLSKEKQQLLFTNVVQFEDKASINRFGAGLGLYSK